MQLVAAAVMRMVRQICLLTLLLLAACGGPGSELPLLPDAGPPDYSLGPGDQVRIITYGEENPTGEFRVNDSGNISLPLIGAVHAAGLTSSGLEGAVATALRHGDLVRGPSVAIEVISYRSIYVLGEVNKPGQYAYQPGMTVLSAIALSMTTWRLFAQARARRSKGGRGPRPSSGPAMSSRCSSDGSDNRSRFGRVGAAVLAALSLAAAADTPAPGPLHIIGSQATGCLAGAVQLPSAGVGFQTIHRARSSFWGAPSTISRIESLAAQAHSAGLGDLYIEDISRPRGGPLPGGHQSHQLGLDVDVGLDTAPKRALTAAEREQVELTSMVRPDQRAIDQAHWSPEVITLLRLAASLPDVDRILINPAIKRQLCQDVRGDRSWLRLMRPWYDHAAHMHIRFRCPADQHDCAQAPPPPPGDGCDGTLQWWFDQLALPPKPTPPYRPPPLPAACKVVMQAP